MALFAADPHVRTRFINVFALHIIFAFMPFGSSPPYMVNRNACIIMPAYAPEGNGLAFPRSTC